MQAASLNPWKGKNMQGEKNISRQWTQ